MDFNLRRSQYKTSFIELTGLVTACQLWESIDLMKPGGGGGGAFRLCEGETFTPEPSAE